jgi:hypothetical protein
MDLDGGVIHPEISCLLSIKLPMNLDVWIWMGGNPFLGAFEGVGPEMATSVAYLLNS